MIGAAAARRRTDSLTLAIIGFCGIAAVGSVLDHFAGVPQALKTGVDAAFLLAGLALLAVLVRKTSSTARAESPR